MDDKTQHAEPQTAEDGDGEQPGTETAGDSESGEE